MSLTTYTSIQRKQVLADPEQAREKNITVLSGETAVGPGQVLIRQKSSDKYKVMSAFATEASVSAGAGAIADNDVSVAGTLASAPVIPKSLTIYGTISAALATITDNGKGFLVEASGASTDHVEGGWIDYETGDWKLDTVALQSTDLFTANAYTHLTNMGSGLDIEDLAIILGTETVDASSADKKIMACDGGEVIAGDLTPTVTITTAMQESFFKNAGFKLVASADTLYQA